MPGLGSTVPVSNQIGHYLNRVSWFCQKCVASICQILYQLSQQFGPTGKIESSARANQSPQYAPWTARQGEARFSPDASGATNQRSGANFMPPVCQYILDHCPPLQPRVGTVSQRQPGRNRGPVSDSGVHPLHALAAGRNFHSLLQEPSPKPLYKLGLLRNQRIRNLCQQVLEDERPTFCSHALDIMPIRIKIAITPHIRAHIGQLIRSGCQTGRIVADFGDAALVVKRSPRRHPFHKRPSGTLDFKHLT